MNYIKLDELQKVLENVSKDIIIEMYHEEIRFSKIDLRRKIIDVKCCLKLTLIKSEKKLSYKDMGLVRLEIIKENLNDNLNVRTVVITSIFYFGKVKVKENYNQNRGDVFSSNFIPTEGE